MIQKILVATDFSEYSEHALQMAIELALREGATLTLLHVCQVPTYAYASGDGMVAAAPELLADLQADARLSLADLEQRLAARGIPIETVSIEGEPGDAIPRFAAERGHDLIVIGSHGRHGFKRFFLGSVSERVVRAASMPVLVAHLRPESASVVGAV